jgi:hypothetical protein
MEGARFSKERDHELFEYGVLVTHMSSRYAIFEKEKPWQDGQCSLLAHVFKVRDFRERKIIAPGGVFFGRIYTESLLVFEKERLYATFDTHSSNSYAGQAVDFRKRETM